MSGSNPADSTQADTSLTVDQAADQIEALLSREDEDTGEDQTDPAAAASDGDGEAPAQDRAEPPEDPEAEEEAEGEEGDEGEEGEGDEAPEDHADAAGTITVDFDGTAVTLTAEEVKKGYLREADYTRKTQTFAQERQQFLSEVHALRQERQQYAALLPAIQQQLQQMLPEEPDWDRLSVEDPVRFNQLWAAKQLRDQKAAAVQQEQQRLQYLASQEAEQAEQQVLAVERQKMLDAIPAWKDPEVWRKDRVLIRDYLKSFGYNDGEISAVTDSRAVQIVRKSMLYDEAMKKAPRPTVAKPAARPNGQNGAVRPQAAPPVKPGPATRQPVSDLTRAKQRFAKTHSLDDAAALIERLI